MDKVDVALATYNGGTHLPAFLRSVADQTREVRLVVSDDRSTDDTVRQVRAASPPGTIVVENSGARGFRQNFNNALAHTDAPYVALADQDDIWLPAKVERLMARMQAIEAEVGPSTPILVCSDLTVVDESLRVTRESFYARSAEPVAGVRFVDLVYGNRVPGCSMLVNRALLDLALPIPDGIVFHDWWLLLIAVGLGRFAVLPEPQILYRQHGNNQIGDSLPRESFGARLLKKLVNPAGQLRARATFYRDIVADPRATLGAYRERFGSRLGSHERAVLEAVLEPGLVRKLRLLRAAHAPQGGSYKLWFLFFLDRASIAARRTREPAAMPR